PADISWDCERTNHDQQQLAERRHGGSGLERYKHGDAEPSIGGERCESEFWQRDGEHGDDPVVDADLDRNGAGNGEYGCDYRCCLYDCLGQFASDTEPHAIDDAACAFPADISWDCRRTDHDQQQLVERQYGGRGPERYEHGSTESAVGD